MTRITPEEAQAQSELDWTAMTKENYSHNCGWCDFSSGSCEDTCPVARLAKMHCTDIPEYKTWRSANTSEDTRRAAQAILDLLIGSGEQLIKVGYEILADRREELSDG